MIISNIRTESTAETVSLVATIAWEQAQRETKDYYFRVNRNHADKLSNGADAFFFAALIPAMSNGETRITIDQPVCATLVDNAEEALFWIRCWNQDKYAECKPLQFDVELTTSVSLGPEKSSLFMSGGLDACFSLLHNAQSFPKEHPGRITSALLIGGFDIGGRVNDAETEQTKAIFERASQLVKNICDHFDVELCTLETNIRHLDDTPGFWGQEFCGAAFAACGHAMGAMTRNFYLSSDTEPLTVTKFPEPFGHHQLITPCYASYQLNFRHYGSQIESRREKLVVVAAVPEIINNLRVCYRPPADYLNCGTCEKCVRTMLDLNALGLLEGCKAFNVVLTPELVEKIEIQSDSAAVMFEQLLIIYRDFEDPAYKKAIKTKLNQYSKYTAWRDQTDWKGQIKRADRLYLNGMVTKLFSRD